jgi:S1-C subfamily serine protease
MRSLVLVILCLLLAACGSGRPAGAPIATRGVFELVVPSVVAILNDDRATRDEEDRRAMQEIGVDEHAPKTIIDVSLRKEPTPHGTGFMIEGGFIVTAAHVVLSPEQLKITTRSGQTVEAELAYIDEVRDVALLRPKTKIDVPPIALAKADPQPGHQVWALGHTGNGLWALAWGISEGIASGTVDLLGSKLLLFDAPVYPGFSGGPVVTLEDGQPAVVGVNHAILFAGLAVATISSAASDIRDVVARKQPPIEPKLAAYAKKRGGEARAELFITQNFAVHKDANMLTSAMIVGNERTIEIGHDENARVPVVAMLFGLPRGDHDVSFELLDPSEQVVDTITRTIKVSEHERVSFAAADFRFEAKSGGGHYDVVAKAKGKSIGRTVVWVQDPDDEDQPVDADHTDQEEDGEPTVEVVVASFGREDPFALAGIRAGWLEWRYPRRVDFTWYARGSRGWSGTNVAITAFVLDESGKIVGRGVGCFKPELRPEHAWSCAGAGGTPLVGHTGPYDIVFAINDRPIAVWPMEAMVRNETGASALDKWLKDLRKTHSTHHHDPKPKPAPPSPPAKPTPTPPAKPPVKPAPKK